MASKSLRAERLVPGNFYLILIKGNPKPAWWMLKSVYAVKDRKGNFDFCLSVHAEGHLINNSVIWRSEIAKIKEMKPKDARKTIFDPWIDFDFGKNGTYHERRSSR